jgi:hypothetical protein
MCCSHRRGFHIGKEILHRSTLQSCIVQNNTLLDDFDSLFHCNTRLEEPWFRYVRYISPSNRSGEEILRTLGLTIRCTRTVRTRGQDRRWGYRSSSLGRTLAMSHIQIHRCNHRRCTDLRHRISLESARTLQKRSRRRCMRWNHHNFVWHARSPSRACTSPWCIRLRRHSLWGLRCNLSPGRIRR